MVDFLIVFIQLGSLPKDVVSIKAKQTDIPLPLACQAIQEAYLPQISAPHHHDIQSVTCLDRGNVLSNVLYACSGDFFK